MNKMYTGQALKLIGLYLYLRKNGKMSQDLYDKLIGNVTVKHVIGY